eukprot:CAMPEP_0118871580 /NCGR_PEP_ID=MMETSP1163-20130328/14110_1 /TAXON_ID=124430 /ORGANISM="Phaeomonas parva, Strain CCMP2877" /LENGTH=76 /DNA_ID=CAMNT_0006806691 /DNA_START=81 /DNA_END=312 /DNA_ORIENTATION=-
MATEATTATATAETTTVTPRATGAAAGSGARGIIKITEQENLGRKEVQEPCGVALTEPLERLDLDFGLGLDVKGLG